MNYGFIEPSANEATFKVVTPICTILTVATRLKN